MKKPIHKLLAVATFVSAASTSAIAAPRTLPNGAPAPGNVVAKGETSGARLVRATSILRSARHDLARALAEERTAAAALKAEPRTHANGAPACGNKPTRAPCTAERANEEWDARVARLVQAGVAIRAAQQRVAASQKEYVALGGADRALLDPVPSELATL